MADNQQQVIKAGTGGTVTVRQDLAEETSITRDLSPTAAAAAAKAEIEALIISARKWPRDEDVFREKVLKTCRRPGFANTALYHKPVGRKKNAQGQWEEAFAIDWTIGSIQTMLQHFGNVRVVARITFEDSDQALLTVQVLDLERNIGYSTDAMLDKLIERKEVKAGRKARGMRENSFGDTVFLVEATRDEFRNVVGAERSKLIRDNGKRLLPRDILDEARLEVDRTLANETAKDPDAMKKKVLDGFASIGISAALLKEYLDRPLETLTAKDFTDLRALFNGLKEGAFVWSDVMRMKAEAAEGGAEKERPKLRDKILGMPPVAAQAGEAAASKPGELKE
jgi:hypothetical protein